MPRWTLEALNVFFLVFHTGLVVFNMAGWAWKRTRKIHLVTVGLTAFSWLVMGIWKGIGYCICTDWHWQVRRALGYRDHDSTYIQFLIREFTGWRPSDDLVTQGTGIAFAITVILTVALNIRDYRASGVSRKKE